MKMPKFGGNSDVHYDSLQYDNEPVDNNSPDSDSAELVSSSYSFNSRCYCGEAQGHEWAHTSQWMPPLSLTSEPDAEVPLESDIDLYDSQTGTQSIYSSPVHQEASTNGLHSDIPYSVPPKKHPNNQVLKIKRDKCRSYKSFQFCGGRCIEAVRLEEENAQLRGKVKELLQEIEKLKGDSIERSPSPVFKREKEMTSNSQLLEKKKNLSEKEVVAWLKSIDNTLRSEEAHENSYRTIITKCENAYKSLKRSESKSEAKIELEELLEKEISFPTPIGVNRACKPKTTIECQGSCSYVNASYDLAEEVNTLINENNDLKKELYTLQKKQNLKIKYICITATFKKQKNTELKRVRLRLARNETKFDKLNREIVKEKKLIVIGGKYSCELRTCIYSLLGLNIAASNVSSVRNTVLNLVGKKVEKLPSRTTILDMNIERLVLSQKQLNETLPNKDNMTLYTDETTKFGTKYSGKYSMTLMKGHLKQTRQAAQRVLANITSTISDRASTEKRFNT
ncbi:hypothetical protein MAR_024168 [Mya arenaria]|uniref:BEN domain-containing protein n=1 Tax=Mya arenaria TaxID=6604 RepID=A0ABY7DSZ3_MYAAR|nr:hypothetical protein MAR_024168 [Mya arenaria]